MKKTMITISLVVLAVFTTATTTFARQRAVAPGNPADHALKANILVIQNRLLKSYGSTSFDWVYDQMIVHGDKTSAGNFALIPIVQASAYTVKYELESQNPQFIPAALDRLEKAESLYPYWGQSWLSPAVVNIMVLTMNRLRQDAGNDPLYGSRIESDWQMTLSILAQEADYWLGQVLPLAPLDSSTTGDTKAEEDAWIASPLSTAAVFLPGHPHAADWEAKAKAVVYAAVTRPSDPPYKSGDVKTTTVLEDFSLDNHGFTNNAYYSAATIELMQQAAVPYLVAGMPVPAEFSHNVSGLYAKYQTYISLDGNGRPSWNVACDTGDPTDLPVVMGDGSEYRYAALKANSDVLWQASSAVGAEIVPADQLWSVIQDHKVAWRYFVNTFLVHWPQPVH